MHLLASVLIAAEAKAPLIMPNWAFALIAFSIFFILGLVTWTYRDVANRHAVKAATTHHDDHEHGSAGHHH
jgi:cbb3-type cytochrome oxidase subunit 3